MISDYEFLELCRKFAGQEGTTLLYSGGNYETSQCSYLCLLPSHKIVIPLQENQDPWESLKSQIFFDGEESDLPAWVGYLSYEFGAFSDGQKNVPFHKPSIPLAIFYKPTVVIKLDKQKGAGELFCHEKIASFPMQCIQKTSYEEYTDMISRAKEYILNGNIYQVNLSHQTLFEGKICPFAFLESVLSQNPAPFAAYMNAGNFTLLSSSPERFLKKTGQTLMAMPIKGTRPRGVSEIEDARLQKELLSSTKERSELLMITDLLRNDLAKVSLPGSVKVPLLYHLETYRNVFHLSSVILSEAKPMHPIDILRAAFPGGSISGCPKLKALEIIYELEKRPRNAYTGSIGYLTNRGDFDFNISIRTCLYKDEILDIQLGAGIVFDSAPESEYLETLAKGTTLFGVIHEPSKCFQFNRSHS